MDGGRGSKNQKILQTSYKYRPLVCIMAALAFRIMDDGGDETELVVVERRRPAESTDWGAAEGDAAAAILSRWGMRVWL